VRGCETRDVVSSQRDGGSRGQPGSASRPDLVVSSPDYDGTHRHYRTVRVRQARREGGREEPAL